jgi:hypothetical protein
MNQRREDLSATSQIIGLSLSLSLETAYTIHRTTDDMKPTFGPSPIIQGIVYQRRTKGTLIGLLQGEENCFFYKRIRTSTTIVTFSKTKAKHLPPVGFLQYNTIQRNVCTYVCIHHAGHGDYTLQRNGITTQDTQGGDTTLPTEIPLTHDTQGGDDTKGVGVEFDSCSTIALAINMFRLALCLRWRTVKEH